MKKFILFSILLVSLSSSIIAQEEFETKVDTSGIEVFLIDAYVKQEPPVYFYFIILHKRSLFKQCDY